MIFDLSLPIDDAAPEPFPVAIERIGHAEGADRLGRKFTQAGKRPIGRDSFPEGMFLSHESVTASVHCGTHMDAPWHFGPVSEGAPARAISDVPLGWCYGDGVVLDMTRKAPGDEITDADVESALKGMGYVLKPGDIALIMTGADKYFGSKEYFQKFAGLSVPAALYLLERGVKVLGTDAPGLDRPSAAMVEDYYRTGDGGRLWPVHMLGRSREYAHIERLAGLDRLPRPFGFKFACFPVKIKDAGAAWARAVAIFEE